MEEVLRHEEKPVVEQMHAQKGLKRSLAVSAGLKSGYSTRIAVSSPSKRFVICPKFSRKKSFFVIWSSQILQSCLRIEYSLGIVRLEVILGVFRIYRIEKMNFKALCW